MEEELEVKKAKTPKKYKFEKDDKKFIEWIRRHFTSLSARRMPYVYFNITDNKYQYFFTNSDTEDIVVYGDGGLSIHVVTFKDNFEYLDRLHKLLNIEESKITIRHLPNWLSQITTYGFEAVKHWNDPKGFIVATLNPEELQTSTEDKPYESRQIIGYDRINFHIPIKLAKLFETHKDMHERFPTKSYRYTVDTTLPLMGMVIFEQHDLSSIEIDGKTAFEDTFPMTYAVFDGLSGPATKEFLIKTKEPYFYERIWIFEQPDFCRVLSCYSDSQISVFTIRPNTGIYVLYKPETPPIKEVI